MLAHGLVDEVGDAVSTLVIVLRGLSQPLLRFVRHPQGLVQLLAQTILQKPAGVGARTK
jgi:hypothetical protein